MASKERGPSGWEKCASGRARILLLLGALDGGVLEAGIFLEESQRHIASGAVSLFGDDESGLAGGFFFGFLVFSVIFVADEESDDVGILLDGAGFAEIAEARTAGAGACALLGVSVQLGQNDDGEFELFSEGFDAIGDFLDFDLAVLLGAAGAGAENSMASNSET
jgi:hypothetical protein